MLREGREIGQKETKEREKGREKNGRSKRREGEEAKKRREMGGI